VKKVLEIIVCFLHPLAVVLAWINLLGRSDLSGVQKLAWAVFMIVPIVPFVYVLTGGDLW
jgi:NADH:ubiquinone oxidoreductase subunit 3 (subunit A)